MPKYIRDGRAPIPKSETISRVFSKNKAKNTKPEMLLRQALWAAEQRGYRIHYKKAAGKPDISFVGEKLAIFVNGCFWHRCPHCQLKLPKSNTEFWQKKFARNVERDQEKTQALIDQGWRVIVVWECEIKRNIAACVQRVIETRSSK